MKKFIFCLLFILGCSGIVEVQSGSNTTTPQKQSRFIKTVDHPRFDVYKDTETGREYIYVPYGGVCEIVRRVYSKP